MFRYRAVKGVTALTYAAYGLLLLIQPAFLFATISLEVLLTASTVLGGLFMVTAVVATYAAFTGDLKWLDLARIFAGSTALAMTAIYAYTMFFFSWGALLGFIVWFHIGTTTLLRQVPPVEQIEQVSNMLTEMKAIRNKRD